MKVRFHPNHREVAVLVVAEVREAEVMAEKKMDSGTHIWIEFKTEKIHTGKEKPLFTLNYQKHLLYT